MKKEKWYEVPACTYVKGQAWAVETRFLIFARGTSKKNAQQVLERSVRYMEYKGRKVYFGREWLTKLMPEEWEPSQSVVSRHYPCVPPVKAEKVTDELYRLLVEEEWIEEVWR